MSFYIHLKNNTEPYNKINKNTDSMTTLTLSGELTDASTIVDPVILVEYNGALTGFNYAHIPEFGRYYFIKNVESVHNGLWSIEMHTDVLKSFSNAILNSPAIVSRSSSNFNMLLNDDHYFTQENPYIFTKEFPSGFDTSTASYVLALVGVSVASE